MHQEVITQTPVNVTSPNATQPKKSLRWIGLSEIAIAIFFIGFGAHAVYVLSSNGYGLKYQTTGWLFIAAGVLIIIAGSLAISASANPSGCNANCGIFFAILASLAALGWMVVLGMTMDINYTGSVALPLTLFSASLLEFILAIAHASLGCGCGNSHQIPTHHTAVKFIRVPSNAPPKYK